MSGRLNRQGFTLLEVLIAVAILAAGISVILQALSYSARVTAISGDIQNAVFLIQDKLQEIEFFKERRDPFSSEKIKEEGQDNRFNWTYALEPLDAAAGVYKLDLEVNWQRQNREGQISISSYLKCLK